MAISENFLPAPPPFTGVSPELWQYLDEEMARLALILNADTLQLQTLAQEPEKPENGMIAYADGSEWNPGSGEGFYGYENGSWVKL